MAVQVVKRRFTVEEYHRMGRVGILTEDDRVELIEGEINVMTPIGSSHAGEVNLLLDLLAPRLEKRALLAAQNPISIGPDSEPQPDLALLRPRPDFYRKSHPGPEDILLLIEISDTSTEYGRAVKVPLYARAGIQEVWIVDLSGACVEVYRRPSPRGHEQVQHLSRGQSVTPLAFPDILLAVNDILA